MVTVRNSELVRDLLRTFIRVIGRRTSESFALETINAVIKNLQPTYEFFVHIEIKTAVYSGEMDAVYVNPEIDAIEPIKFGKAVGKIIDTIATLLGENEQYDFENAEYYFINEVKDDLGEEYEVVFKKTYDVDLTIKQSEFLNAMQEAAKGKILKIKTSDVLEYSIRTLLSMLNRKHSEADATKIMVATLKKLEQEYSFFKYVQLRDIPDQNGLYPLHILREIDTFLPSKRVEGIQTLIEEIGKTTDIKTRRVFIDHFGKELGPKYVSQLRKIGVKLPQIDKNLQQQVYEILVKRTFDVLIKLIGKKTSISFAVALLDTIIDPLREKYEVLEYIVIDKSRYDAGVDAFRIAPEINLVDEYKLGKALKEILRKTQDKLGDEAVSFVEAFKKDIGDDDIVELEKLGVNLHILELRGIM